MAVQELISERTHSLAREWVGGAILRGWHDHAPTAPGSSPIMSDKHIKLTRRRAIGGLITIGGAAAAAGAGTFALFSDTESSTGNSLSAGTLDLELGSSNTLTFSGSNIAPTDSGSTYADLQKNSSSSIAGDLSVDVTNVASSEGTDVEAETDTSSPGDLDDQLEMRLWIGTGGSSDTTPDTGDIGLESDGTTVADSAGTWETAANYSGTTWSDVITNFSGPVAFNVEWRFPDQSGNNDAQGDDITVDFAFTLQQQ